MAIQNDIIRINTSIDLRDYDITPQYSGEGYIDVADLGIEMSDGGITALLTPPPNKAYVSNSSRSEHGTRIVAQSARMNERQVNMPFHMTATSRDQFFKQYRALCDILAQGEIILYCSYVPLLMFRMVYQSCTQFGSWGQHESKGLQLAKFTLRLIEPDPSNRSLNRDIRPHLQLDRDRLDDEKSQLI